MPVTLNPRLCCLIMDEACMLFEANSPRRDFTVGEKAHTIFSSGNEGKSQFLAVLIQLDTGYHQWSFWIEKYLYHL